MESLSPDTIGVIFSFLEISDVGRLQRVNKLWRTLLQEDKVRVPFDEHST